MARLARAEIFIPSEIAAVHVMARTVRRCFLLGHDDFTGKNFDHRKGWIEDKLKELAAQFGIDLLAFSCMSNHFHLLLRSRPDVVATWDDTEVAKRWWNLCPKRRVKDWVDGKRTSSVAEATEYDLNSIRNDPVMLAKVRSRLSDISWWMRLLCQYIAVRANAEDGQGLGKFWQSRYKAVRILDEESLLACAAYIDLNPIRAALADTIENSDFTSVQRRIESMRSVLKTTDSHTEFSSKSASIAAPTHSAPGSETEPQPLTKRQPDHNLPSSKPINSCNEHRRNDAFLAPVQIHEMCDPVGAQVSRTKQRCSDKGFLPLADAEYFEILDWVARDHVAAKPGVTPMDMPPVFARFQIDSGEWLAMVRNFGRTFKHVAGKPHSIESARSLKSHRKFYRART